MDILLKPPCSLKVTCHAPKYQLIANKGEVSNSLRLFHPVLKTVEIGPVQIRIANTASQ